MTGNVGHEPLARLTAGIMESLSETALKAVAEATDREPRESEPAFRAGPVSSAAATRKPMRLRILELPTNYLGQASDTPFCLVFDNASHENMSMIEEMTDGLKDKVGARAVLVFEDSIELD
ncbi:hypothetical protein [Nocardia wallacei]|uniref:hypothetical protein n=1 Tax=Nocardia wallacei TaxID=480035 RepID=UPI00245687A0|nr:hypothetical protein [Nocardia wallacei]